MHIFDNRRMRFAWLLMLVYLPMMTAITFHHHSEAEEASAVSHCYDCEHPVRISLTIACSASCIACHTWYLLSYT